MSDHHVQIALPITTVRLAWRRYVGYGVFDSDAEDGAWRADNETGLEASFTIDGPALTTVALSAPDAAELDDLLEGFVAYIEPIRAELTAIPGSTAGAAPVGPDGTAHMPQQPLGLGTDNDDPGAEGVR